MPFTTLKSLLPRAIRQAGLEASVSAARVVEEADAALVRVWGAERAAFVRVISCVGDTLQISVTSPSAMHALRQIEVAWMNELNRTIGTQRIKKIIARREGF